MRKQIAAANWKMNLGFSEAQTLVNSLINKKLHIKSHQQILLAIPFPYLMNIKQLLADYPQFDICAQNLAANKNGAYTGEVSAEMLKSIDIKYALIGHSERRVYYHEDNIILAHKIDQALSHQINPVFCCGEPLSIRENGQQNEYVETQLKESLFHLSTDAINNFIIAYEPIWAIGTGKTASSDQAQDMHHFIRKTIAAHYNDAIAESVSILYGGSVKGANSNEIFNKVDVDGGLVGGASLNADEFATIIYSLK